MFRDASTVAFHIIRWVEQWRMVLSLKLFEPILKLLDLRRILRCHIGRFGWISVQIVSATSRKRLFLRRGDGVRPSCHQKSCEDSCDMVRTGRDGPVHMVPQRRIPCSLSPAQHRYDSHKVCCVP